MYIDPGLFTGVGLIISIILLIVGLIIEIAILVWVYKDAKKRGENEVLWLIVVLLTGCIGCLIYLIVRKK